MPITQAFCNSFKRDCFFGPHQRSDVYKIALFTASAQLDADTTVYSSINEVEADGYTRGGVILEGLTVGLDGDTAIVDWTVDPIWRGTIAAAGALIYNASRGNKALAVVAFDGTYASEGGVFTLTLPPPSADKALIRIR